MINGNHQTMCRFLDHGDDVERYRVVWTNLKAIAEELLSTDVTYITSK
jgi:hypothetical protein